MSTIPDKPAILYLNKHQFICKDCQKSFIAETTEVKKNSNTSKNPKTGTINKVIQREYFKKKQLNLVMHSLILHREYNMN